MRRFRLTLGAVILHLVKFMDAQNIQPITAVGSKFFYSGNGEQFFMKGVAYQLIEDDPLVDVQQCTRDAALMKQLGANSIRVYHVNATADHSGCMNVFASAGIYAWVDLDSFQTYIRYDTESSWTQNKSDAYRAVMDNFQQYDNTGGFFVGNEVLNTVGDSGAAPYVLAAAVDMAAYRDRRGYRRIPIGYSATDTDAIPMLQDYFVCRPNATERLEFYALNSYRWCGAASNYNTSGYNQLQARAEGYPVPIFFSETGCNTVPPRDFNDQTAIFGPEMDGTWSGSIIYEWIQEMNGFGLITYGPHVGNDVQIGSSVIQGFTRQGTPTPVQPDFSNLQRQWATLSPTGVASSAYVTAISTSSRTCPAFTAGGWTVDPSAELPTLGAAGVTAASNTFRTTAVGTRSTVSGQASGSVASSTSSGVASTYVYVTVSPTFFGDGIHLFAMAMAVMIGILMVFL